MATLRPYLLGVVACAVLVVVCYAFVDRPAALFVHTHGGSVVFLRLQQIPDLLYAAAPAVLVLGGLGLVAQGRLPAAPRAGLLAAVSFTLAAAIKDQLKYVFGRTWPDTWVNHNPSFIQNGVFGFFPFHGGRGWASFPSGHMTVTSAAFVVLWCAYPRLWPLWAALILAVAAGLLGMDYHFVSDMIAGTFLGTGVASATWAVSVTARGPPAAR